MDRISKDSPLNSSGADRTSHPNLDSSSPKTIAELIEFVAKADNEAIEKITQTYFPVLEDTGADAIMSFFYAVTDSFDRAVTSKKFSLFALLSDCACKAAGKIPDESRLQMIAQLSQMTFIDTNDVQEMSKMANSLGSIIQSVKDELNFLNQSPVAMNQAADLSRYSAVLSETLSTFLDDLFRIINDIDKATKYQPTFSIF